MTDPSEALAHELDEQRRTIMAYEAGPELDALVQRRVFKTGIYEYSGVKRIVVNEPHALEAELIPPYSTEAGAAMAILEHLGGVVCLERDARGWYCHVSAKTGLTDECGGWRYGEGVIAQTAPLAIVKAALLAVAEARSR